MSQLSKNQSNFISFAVFSEIAFEQLYWFRQISSILIDWSKMFLAPIQKLPTLLLCVTKFFSSFISFDIFLLLKIYYNKLTKKVVPSMFKSYGWCLQFRRSLAIRFIFHCYQNVKKKKNQSVIIWMWQASKAKSAVNYALLQ